MCTRVNTETKISFDAREWNHCPARGRRAVEIYYGQKHNGTVPASTRVVTGIVTPQRPHLVKFDDANVSNFAIVYFVSENAKERSVTLHGGIRNEECAEAIVSEQVYKLASKAAATDTYVYRESLAVDLVEDKVRIVRVHSPRGLSANILFSAQDAADLVHERLLYLKMAADYSTLKRDPQKNGAAVAMALKTLTTQRLFAEECQCVEPLDSMYCHNCYSFFYTMFYFAWRSGDPRLCAWWAQQEAGALFVKLTTPVLREEAVRACVQKNSIFKIIVPLPADHSPATKKYMAVERGDSKGIAPETCFTMPHEACFDVQSNPHCAIRAGTIYLSYAPVAEIVLPKMYESAILDALAKGWPVPKTPAAAEEDNLGAAVNGDCKMEELMEQTRRATYEFHPKIGSGSTADVVLPDIEDVHKFMPPCAWMAHQRMLTTSDLKHRQRQGFVNYLRGLGYSSSQVEGHVVGKCALAKSEAILEIKTYANKPLPVDTKNGWSDGCKALCSPDAYKGLEPPDDRYYCPFKHMSPIDLDAFLIKRGCTNGDVRKQILADRKTDPQLACKREMNFHARSGSYYSPSSPQWYTRFCIKQAQTK